MHFPCISKQFEHKTNKNKVALKNWERKEALIHHFLLNETMLTFSLLTVYNRQVPVDTLT